jgi:hypothetical protein
MALGATVLPAVGGLFFWLGKTSPRWLTTSWIDRSRKRAMPMTSHTTIGADNLRRRTEAVPVSLRAWSIHCASSTFAKRLKLVGMSVSWMSLMDTARDMGPPHCH